MNIAQFEVGRYCLFHPNIELVEGEMISIIGDVVCIKFGKENPYFRWAGDVVAVDKWNPELKK